MGSIRADWTAEAVRPELRFAEPRQLLDFRWNIKFIPPFRIWSNSAGIWTNCHANVTWLECKQTQKYCPKACNDDPAGTGRVDDWCLQLFLEASFGMINLVCMGVGRLEYDPKYDAFVPLQYRRLLVSSVHLVMVAVPGSIYSGLRNAERVHMTYKLVSWRLFIRGPTIVHRWLDQLGKSLNENVVQCGLIVYVAATQRLVPKCFGTRIQNHFMGLYEVCIITSCF